MVDVSIIIVSYNTEELIIKCLNSILQYTTGATFEIIIIDNKSSDNSVKQISKLFIDDLSISDKYKKCARIKMIINESNLGFSKANNIGVREAKGKYLLFLNSDTELLQTHTIEEMIEFMELHQSVGAATCILILNDGTMDDAIHRGFPTPWNAFCHFSGLGKLFKNSLLFNGYHLGWKDIDKVHEIDALAGAFMIVRRKAGEQMSWWDEDYFFYGEDIDFCYRLKKGGWKIFFVPTVKILHHKGVSSGIKKHSQNISKANNLLKLKIQESRFDAMRIFYKKHYSQIYNPIITNLVLTGIALRQKLK